MIPKSWRHSILAITVLAAGASANIARADEPTVDTKLPWSQRMADSILARQPKALLIENKDGGSAKWSYSTAFCVRAVTQVGVFMDKSDPAAAKYVRYGKDYMDNFINADGVIDPKAYDPKGYRLDDIAPGQLVLILLDYTKDDRYKKAAYQLAEQLKTQPRIDDGGFWHKTIYPQQMWLDGIFMDCPFMTRFGKMTDQPAYFDEVVKQITLLAKHAQDPKTGLLYHGWDAAPAGKKQPWADPVTGLSKNFWGRGMGWYLAGIVESLDYLPDNHPGRSDLTAILQKAAAGLEKVQDPRDGLWFQVLDQGTRAGNYHEASASSMFTYVLAKAARKGYIDAHYADVAKKAYAGITSELIDVDPKSGLLTLKDTCLVAGLGPGNTRNGTYEYYLSEKRVSNDPKGMAPFILASLELEGKK
jgi:unsaturated rhamnogalacturonyl hydrolase